MDSLIGIKLADGTFFPILSEDALSEKELELTTVRDHQESVQINLFKKAEEGEPAYIGSLIVEDIADGLSGDPTINLKIKLDADKNLSAEAEDEGSGSRQSLKVSLKTLDEETFDVPDFNLAAMDESMGLGEDPEREDVLIPETDSLETDFTETEKEEKKKKPAVGLIVLLILLCIGALVAAILLLTKKMPVAEKGGMDQQLALEKTNKEEAEKRMDEVTDNPPVQDPSEKAMNEKAAAEQQAKEQALMEEAEKAAKEEAERAEAAAKAERERAEKEAAAAAKEKAEAEQREALRRQEEAKKNEKKKSVPSVGANGTVRYKVKWGDTLWDLSETFYKNPWLYKKIAKHNKIKNPSLIVSGTYIEIPPK